VKAKIRHPSRKGKCLVKACGFQTDDLDEARAHFRDTGHTTWEIPSRWLREADTLSFKTLMAGGT